MKKEGVKLLHLIKKRKVLFFCFFAVMLLIAGIYIYKKGDQSGYVFEKAKRTTVTEIVSESGTISPDGSTAVYSPTNGIISEIYVKNGTSVKKGENLFKVVSSATDAEKQTAYANYLTAKSILDADTAGLYSLQSAMYSAWKTYKDIATNSTFENSDGTANKTNRVLTEFTTLQDNWLAAEANYKNQQSVIAKDQANLNSTYTLYLATQTTVVKSPVDSGIVSNLSYAPGNSVNALTALNLQAKPVLVMKNSDLMWAVINVGQSNIAKIKEGQKVIISPDAYKDKEYSGVVDRIDSLGENLSGVVNYNVYVNIKADGYLKPGMTFDSDIFIEKLNNVLTVSNSAVVVNKGVKSVRTIDKGTVKYFPVKTGIKGETRTQIISGISEGTEIISAITNEKSARPGFMGL